MRAARQIEKLLGIDKPRWRAGLEAIIVRKKTVHKRAYFFKCTKYLGWAHPRVDGVEWEILERASDRRNGSLLIVKDGRHETLRAAKTHIEDEIYMLQGGNW